jgi:hypothetical protein
VKDFTIGRSRDVAHLPMMKRFTIRPGASSIAAPARPSARDRQAG